jgi:hypothetical protein
MEVEDQTKLNGPHKYVHILSLLWKKNIINTKKN